MKTKNKTKKQENQTAGKEKFARFSCKEGFVKPLSK